MKVLSVILALTSLGLSGCNGQTKDVRREAVKITTTTPQVKSVIVTERFFCQLHSQRHIDVRSAERGYLEAIPVREGQVVQEGDVLFRVQSIQQQTRLDVEKAETRLSQVQLDNINQKYAAKQVPQEEVALAKARLANAQAHLAAVESNFAAVKAPFAGFVGRLHHQLGGQVERGEVLTTLSDNVLMQIYFNVPEARYLKYMADLNQHQDDPRIELELANGDKYPQVGKIDAINAEFNRESGTISFRADFPNPDHRLRHGQTGTVLLHQKLPDAVVIPQRSTFELLDKRYVYVVDQENVAHRREIVIQNEFEDLFVIKKGVGVDDKIVLDGIRKIRDGEKVEYEESQPEHALRN